MSMLANLKNTKSNKELSSNNASKYGILYFTILFLLKFHMLDNVYVFLLCFFYADFCFQLFHLIILKDLGINFV